MLNYLAQNSFVSNIASSLWPTQKLLVLTMMTKILLIFSPTRRKCRWCTIWCFYQFIHWIFWWRPGAWWCTCDRELEQWYCSSGDKCCPLSTQIWSGQSSWLNAWAYSMFSLKSFLKLKETKSCHTSQKMVWSLSQKINCFHLHLLLDIQWVFVKLGQENSFK